MENRPDDSPRDPGNIPDQYADIYNPFRDPVLINQATREGKLDNEYLTHLAREAAAQANMERVFADADAPEEEKMRARDRVAREKHELHDFRVSRGYITPEGS